MVIPTVETRRSGLPVPNSTSSFWHSEPNEFLIGHRTTSDLPSEADIVIVGSGITGTSAARFLKDDKRTEGKKVVMLEAREACWGATGRVSLRDSPTCFYNGLFANPDMRLLKNGGHCQPLLYRRGVDVSAFEIKNGRAVRAYIEENNIPCEYRAVTACLTFWSNDLIEEVKKELDLLHKADPEIAKHVRLITDKEELKKHKVNPDCAGATLTEGAAQLWPYKLITFILEKLIKDGFLNLQTNTPVEKIEALSDPAGYRQALHTPRGVIKAKTVILTTNGYTSYLLPEFADLIVPTRGEMSSLLPPEGSTRLPDSYGFVGARGQSVTHDDYLIHRPYEGVPNPAGHLMFGGGRGAGDLPSVHQYDDSIIDVGAAKYLRETLLEVLLLDGKTEGLKELKASHQWTGIMGYSRDDQPWVGPVPGYDGIFLSGGYTGHGMPNATLCGRAASLMALTETEGGDLGKLAEKLVADGDLPKGYLISEERVTAARNMPLVEQADGGAVLRELSVKHDSPAE